MERDAKLRRLEAFRRSKPHCSASALAHILTDIKRHGLPELTDRASMRKGRDRVAALDTPFGPILKHIEVLNAAGDTVQFPIACPFASLTHALESSTSLQKLVQRQLLRHPCSPESPWNIIIYCDEVTPGNPMAHQNQRRFHAFYWTFLELGPAALSHEESWFIFLTEFSTNVNSLQGGLSACFAAAVKAFFQEGLDMMNGGVTVPLSGDHIKMFAKLGVVLMDGGAHKYVWGARGDAATKYCILCKNLFSRASEVVDDDGTNLLACDVINVSGLVPATDAELRINMRYLEQQSSVVSGEQFALLQQALGLTYHPRGVLVDRGLDHILSPTATYCHDWMHALFVDGVVNLVVYLLFNACMIDGMPGVWESFSDYLSHWRFPARLHAHHLAELFQGARKESHKKAKHIKCQASDLLTVMGPLSQYIKSVLQVADVAANACISMLALCDLVELVDATARISVRPADLEASVHRFLETFVVAFGSEWLTPKAHWLLHLPALLQRFGRLLNCFALERKHRVPKRYANELKNIARCADASLLKECICHHFAVVAESTFYYDVSLIEKRPASKKSRRTIWQLFSLDDDGSPLSVASAARFSPVALCSQNDVVLVQDGDGFRAGRVQVHFELQDIVMTLIQPFALVRKHAALAVWEISDGPSEVWETKAILATVPYSEHPNGRVGTLLPIEFR